MRQTRNRYPTACTACAEVVQPYHGVLTGKVDGRWTAVHDRCPAAEAAQRAADKAYSDTQHSIALAKIAEAGLDEEGLFDLTVLRAAQHNSYVASYQAIVTDSDTMDEFKDRCNAASQGMTMDYMTEFSRERTAIDLAYGKAAYKFGLTRVEA